MTSTWAWREGAMSRISPDTAPDSPLAGPSAPRRSRLGTRGILGFQVIFVIFVILGTHHPRASP